MDYVLLLSVALSFLVAWHVLPIWIRKCHQCNLLWEDMNKWGHPRNVASSGGVVVVMAFIFGVFSYIAFKTFAFSGTSHLPELFALISMILILGVVGLVDDLLGWKRGGLSIRMRLLLALFASVPLMIINAGVPTMTFSFFGPVNVGLWYPLFLVPLGIVGATTTYNFLAGFNGLETGQGVLVLTYLSFVSFATGSPWLSIVGLCMVAALVAFYLFNRFPAKIFPGDILTYSVGALIAGMSILGNFEKAAVIVFIPYILEVGLKLRGGLKKYSLCLAQKDGTLKKPYEKIYSLNHLAVALLSKFGRATERNATYLIHAFQILCILASLATL